MTRGLYIAIFVALLLAVGGLVAYLLAEGPPQNQTGAPPGNGTHRVEKPPIIIKYDNVTMGNVEPAGGVWTNAPVLDPPRPVESVWNITDAKGRKVYMVTATISLSYDSQYPWSVDASLATGSGAKRVEQDRNTSTGPTFVVKTVAQANSTLPQGEWSVELTPHPPSKWRETCSWSVEVVVTFISDETV